MNEKKPLSLIIIIFSIAMFCSYHIYYHFANITNNHLIEDYYEKEALENNSSNPVMEKVSRSFEEKKEEEYLGILMIPKIKLVEGFYNKDSVNNNVSNSVTLLKESIMPDMENSIVYLAAHSGIGHLAYFKDLDKLTNEDIIKIKYHNKVYSYTITDVYEMPRNGQIEVNRNIHENYLILTTCSKNKNMQLVIVSKLFNEL